MVERVAVSSRLLHQDRVFLERFLEMESGWVLDFKDRTFAAFFSDFGVDISERQFSTTGTSKAKRLRVYFDIAPPSECARVLEGLWRHRMRLRGAPDAADENAFMDIVRRLKSGASTDWRSKYKMENVLGEGGQAQVFEVEELATARRYALKQLKDPTDRTTKARAKREIEALQRLAGSAFVVGLVDFDPGATWFVMPLAADSLKARGEQGFGRLVSGLSDMELLRLVGHVVQALGAAHAVGYVHRDIKPSNILCMDAETDDWVLADWGIARNPKGHTSLMMTTHALGTDVFASPEQAIGSHDVDRRADYYSLGRVVAEARCAQRLVPNVQALPEGIWRKFVRNCTEIDPQRRPQSQDALLLLVEEVRLALSPIQQTEEGGVQKKLETFKNQGTSASAREFFNAMRDDDLSLEEILLDELPSISEPHIGLLLAAMTDEETKWLLETWTQQSWGHRQFHQANGVLKSMLHLVKACANARRHGLLEDLLHTYFPHCAGWDQWKHRDLLSAWLSGLDPTVEQVVARVLTREEKAKTWIKTGGFRATAKSPKLRMLFP